MSPGGHEWRREPEPWELRLKSAMKSRTETEGSDKEALATRRVDDGTDWAPEPDPESVNAYAPDDLVRAMDRDCGILRRLVRRGTPPRHS